MTMGILVFGYKILVHAKVAQTQTKTRSGSKLSLVFYNLDTNI